MQLLKSQSSLNAPTIQPKPLIWIQAVPPEHRPDGTRLERSMSNTETSIREVLRVPPKDMAALLFTGPPQGWAGIAMPLKEREVHPDHRVLIDRTANKNTMWRQDSNGTIVETPLTVNPMLGCYRRTFKRYKDEARTIEDPEWARLDTLLGTPL